MGQGKKRHVIAKINNKIVVDKASGVAIATNILAKCYEAGELVWKEDLKKKAKQDRAKIKAGVRSIIKILFLDTYMRMPKPTLNGAFDKMLKGHSKGDYIFKNVASTIPNLKGSSIKSQKKFLEKQIGYIWGTKPKLDKWIRINIVGDGKNDDPSELWGSTDPER